MEIKIPFGTQSISVDLPDGIALLTMKEPPQLENINAAISCALDAPIGTVSLLEIARDRVAKATARGHEATACIVVSDKTRPVPYQGPNGLLRPIIQTLLTAGVAVRDICILIACGTHRAMSDNEICQMIGKDMFCSGVRIVNHDCKNEAELITVGTTARGTVAKINRHYMQADIKILTGLVESHFMAGASGGRKSICPGIFGEEGTFVFHGPELMAHPNARDLVLDGNPVHDESLSVAKLAGADFILNVTLNSRFEITGIFCGDLELAHKAAVEYLKSYVGIPIDEPYDFVITHGGFVAQNHYQAAKAAVAAISAVKPDGVLLQVANNYDQMVMGSERYRVVLSILKLLGAERFEKLLFSDVWKFVPDQWQVQLWARVFRHMDVRNYIYYAPQLDDKDWRDIPGEDGRHYLPKNFAELDDCEKVSAVIRNALSHYLERNGLQAADIASGKCRVAFLQDGPYGVPLCGG